MGGNKKKLNVVDFGKDKVERKVVRITSETIPGVRCATPSLTEVEIDGILGTALDHETHEEVDTDEYIDQSGIGIGKNGELKL